MADIDADLLALAGDSSSDEAGILQTTKAPKSPSPPPLTSGQNDSKERSALSSNKKTSATARAGKKTKKVAHDDSEEEGEAFSAASSPDLLRSASMSESESESSDGKTFDDNSFPLENKYKSLEDKKYINSLSEIQREEILADRAAQVEREQQSRVLRELLKNRERGEGKADKKKRKADEEPEDGNRKTSRQRTTIGGRKVGESSAPLEEYKRQREQRGKENAQRRRDDASRPSKRKDDSSSDADADAESDVEWDDGKAKSGAGHKASPTEEMREPLLRDYDRLKIGHDQFGQVCFYPGFAEAISGCYGRVNLGPDKATGLNCYRMALIKGFTEGRPYAIHPPNGQSFVTTQHVIATMGKAERHFPFIAFSMGHLSEAELARYKRYVLSEGMNLPDLRSLRKKIGDINGLITRTWTDDEITEKVNRSGVKANRYKPFEIARLNGLRKEAVSNEDSEAVAQIDIELAALEDGKLAYGTSLSKSQDPASRAPSQQDRLAMLNRANRKANTEDIRRAQLAEKKAEREAAAAVARGEQAPNAFARVKTRAKVHYDVNDTGPPVSRNYLGDHSGDDRSRAHTPVGDSRSNTPIQSGTPKRSGTPLLTVPGQKTEKGIPTFRRRMMDDEAIASMGIEIDI